MINQKRKETLTQKIQNGEFQAADFSDYFKVFCHLGNTLEDLQDEVEGWDRKIQIDLDGSGCYWISIEEGEFTTGEGKIEGTHLTLSAAADAAVKVFSGEQDGEAAFLSGALKINGDLPDAIKFHELLELVIDEVDY
jgi:putative sterol carrier protein